MQYRINEANILVEQQRYTDAVRVLEAAQSAATNPEAAEAVRLHLQRVRQFRQQMNAAKQHDAELQSQAQLGAGTTTVATPSSGINGQPVHKDIATEGSAPLQHPTEKPHGPMLVAQGVMHGVSCSSPAVLQLQLQSPAKKLTLYNNNRYEIDFTAGNFTPQGELHPCAELEGMKAKVTYFATSDKSVDGQIVSIMMFK